MNPRQIATAARKRFEQLDQELDRLIGPAKPQTLRDHGTLLVLSIVLIALLTQPLCAWTRTAASTVPHNDAEITALMLSDLHVDVFHDPRKIPGLMSAPVGRWSELLAAPDSPTRTQDFNVLATECGADRADPTPALFSATLRAITSDAPRASFITISGDFLPHKIDCMVAKLVPGASAQQYAAFTAKIISYEILQIRKALPHTPLYLALGNNDSNCRDDYLDTNTKWLKTLAEVAHAGVGTTWDRAATESFEQGGYYSVRMAAPMKKTRMIVVNDLLLTRGYRTCSGRTNSAATGKEMVWLRSQLERAREHHEHVWIMGHIPPGMSAVPQTSMDKMCNPGVMPVAGVNEAFADMVIEYSDVVKLAIFGHTHHDQVQLLQGATGAVPVKIVRALPSFTIGKVDPRRAELVDYTVMSRPDPRGVDWTKEYTFSSEYGYQGFTAKTLQGLIKRFQSDPRGTGELSRLYMLHMAGGNQKSLLRLQQAWPFVVCQMAKVQAAAYRQCVCNGRLGRAVGESPQ